MNQAFRSACLALLGTLSAAGAQAASFDCARLTNDAQELVCTHAALSAADEAMAGALREAMDHAEVPVKVRNAQRRWIVGVRDRCATVRCLKDAYEQRIDRLVMQGWRHRLIFTQAGPQPASLLARGLLLSADEDFSQ